MVVLEGKLRVQPNAQPARRFLVEADRHRSDLDRRHGGVHLFLADTFFSESGYEYFRCYSNDTLTVSLYYVVREATSRC